MTPQTNNAYYDPTQNQITFPAAILQPPYFDPNADPAANYGSIGATIGHEIGHGFDDQGRKFDGTGKLRDWWTPATRQALRRARRRAGASNIDSYEPIPGVHIKGQLTLGENLGDLGGLEVAYAAYRRYVAQHGEPPVIDGLTGDQRFFIAYGYSWETKQREGALRAQLLTNEHSARPNIASTASSATSTPGTRRSTSSPATRCTCRRSSAFTSGRRLGKRPLSG